MARQKKYKKPQLKHLLKESRLKIQRQLEKLSNPDLEKVRSIIFVSEWSRERLAHFLDLALPELDYLFSDISIQPGIPSLLLEGDYFQKRRWTYLDTYYDKAEHPSIDFERVFPILDMVTKSLRSYLISKGNTAFINKMETNKDLYETSKLLTLRDHFSEEYVAKSFGVNSDSFEAGSSLKILALCLSKSIRRIKFDGKLRFCKYDKCGMPFSSEDEKRKDTLFHDPKCRIKFHNANRKNEEKNAQEYDNRIRREDNKDKKAKKNTKKV